MVVVVAATGVYGAEGVTAAEATTFLFAESSLFAEVIFASAADRFLVVGGMVAAGYVCRERVSWRVRRG